MGLLMGLRCPPHRNLWWLPGLALFIQGCGGSGNPGAAAPPATQGTAPLELAQSAGVPVTRTVAQQVTLNTGTLELYSDGTAALITPGLQQRMVYSGSPAIQAIAGISGGVQIQFADGKVFFSNDGMNLRGGGSTVELPYVSVTNSDAQFGPRDSARGIEWNGQIWISGGYYNQTQSYFDVWNSGDLGLNWALAAGSPSPQSSPPTDFYDAYSPLVSDGQSLYAIGSKVWKSADGKEWTVITDAGPETAADDSFAYFFDGQFTYFNTNDGNMFSSSDGVAWSYSPGALPMKNRCGAATIAAFGKLWLFGGGGCTYQGVLNDIWNTPDGVNWSRVTVGNAPKDAEWPGRLWPCVASSDTGILWLFGGFTPAAGGQGGMGGSDLADLWYSRDGINWTSLAIKGQALETRHAPTCFFRPDSRTLIIVAGKGDAAYEADGTSDNDAASVSNTVLSVNLPIDGFLQ